MRKHLIISFICTIICINAFAQSKKKVLFIGNSYTDVNNLPKITSDLTASAGDTLIYDSNAPGGYSFQDHLGNTTSLNKIKQGNWDFVVLQEQSQLPSFGIDQVRIEVFPYARALDSINNVYNPCGETMFYMTWGRKNGDADNCQFLEEVCTYGGMDSMLHLRYMMMADDNNAVVSPVGAVWKYIRKNYPSIELYQSDQSHPTLAGSYAAACCFYTSIFRKDPLSITSNYSLNVNDATNIRGAVKAVAYDSLLNWHIGEYDPMADFTSGIINNHVAFNNLSANATGFEWNFGDGDTSSAVSPAHDYAGAGSYPVTLVAHHCNFTDTILKNLILASTGVVNYNNQNTVLFNSNPVSNQLVIHADRIQNILITNTVGQIFIPAYNTAGQTSTIDLSTLVAGIYFVAITINGQVLTRKVVKQ